MRIQRGERRRVIEKKWKEAKARNPGVRAKVKTFPVLPGRRMKCDDGLDFF